MSKVTIYHNPRCSKSRQTLALLEERGVELTVVEYLKNPPTAAELRGLLNKLGLAAKDLVRRSEAVYKELGLADRLDDDDALVEAMAEHPTLIERPIVVVGQKARLGRPPEQVLEVL